MAINNSVILIGNMGSEARFIKTESTEFAAVSVATTDSYKDDSGEWQENETIWHNIIAFSPTLIGVLKSLKKGTRIKVTGSLSYRPYQVADGDGVVITKQEASIIARKIEQAPLTKKKTSE
jgi:single-strand DNA-binding protein